MIRRVAEWQWVQKEEQSRMRTQYELSWWRWLVLYYFWGFGDGKQGFSHCAKQVLPVPQPSEISSFICLWDCVSRQHRLASKSWSSCFCLLSGGWKFSREGLAPFPHPWLTADRSTLCKTPTGNHSCCRIVFAMAELCPKIAFWSPSSSLPALSFIPFSPLCCSLSLRGLGRCHI